MKFKIVKYTARLQNEWDDLIQRSSNGTFLHLRNYMDYHSHRFDDYSLMIYEDTKLRAVLPAHLKNNEVWAHQGLTYSDFIFQKKIKLERKIAIVAQSLKFLYQKNIYNLHIRSIPFAFQSITDESSNYIYHKADGEIRQLKPFFIIDQRNGIAPNQNRKRNYKKLLKLDYQIDNKISDLALFWQIVEENLKYRYQTLPIHSFEEIQILSHRFPDQIKLFTVKRNGQILAGVLVYFINKTVHFQYPHALNNPESRNAIEFLIYELVQKFKDFAYISFGTSAVNNNNLNGNLVYWKESFGAKVINQLLFDIKTQNFEKLKTVLQ